MVSSIFQQQCMDVLNFKRPLLLTELCLLTKFSIRLLTTGIYFSFITLFSNEFTWYTLHKPALFQLCMEGMQSQSRLLPHGRTKLHFDFQHLHGQTQGFDQCIQTCYEGVNGMQPSGSHCTPVSRRRDRWAFLVSSTLFPWWKHSILHMAHCGYEMLRVVHLMSHTQRHILNHKMQI